MNVPVFNFEALTFLQSGGTKAVYKYDSDSSYVVYVPSNFSLKHGIDESTYKEATDWWNEIIEDEMFIQSKCLTYSLPCLDFKSCILENYVKLKDGSFANFNTAFSKSFAEYTKEGVYINDAKNGYYSSMWHKIHPQEHFWGKYTCNVDEILINDNKLNNLDIWLPLFMPMLEDFKLMTHHHLFFGMDSVNTTFIKKGHPWHDGSNNEYIIRLFLFDIASKYNRVDRTIPTISCDYYLNYLYHAVEHALWEVLCPLLMFMPKNIEILVKKIHTRLISML